MYIGCPQLHRFLNHVLNQPDDRSAILVGSLLRLSFVFLGLGEVDLRVGKLLQHRVSGLALDLSIILINSFLNLLAWCECRFDLSIQDEPELFDRLNIERIRNQHLDRLVLVGHRDDLVFTSDRLRH